MLQVRELRDCIRKADAGMLFKGEDFKGDGQEDSTERELS